MARQESARTLLVLFGLCVPMLTGCRDKTDAAAVPPCSVDGPRAAEIYSVQAALIRRWCPPDRLFLTSDEEEQRRESPEYLRSRPGKRFRPVSAPEHYIVETNLMRSGPWSYQATSCMLRLDYDPEDPGKSPAEASITAYAVKVPDSKVEFILVVAKTILATREWTLSFLGDHFFELLDVGDRFTVAEQLLGALAEAGQLDEASRQALEARVGALGEPRPHPRATPRSTLVDGWKTVSGTPLWRVSLWAHTRLLAPCD